jgi:hypothetical protein
MKKTAFYLLMCLLATNIFAQENEQEKKNFVQKLINKRL